MLSNIIIRSTAAFGGAPFRLKKCTALPSAAGGAGAGAAVGGLPGALVGGAFGVASSLLGGLFGKHNTDKTNEMNYKIMQEQNRFNAEEAKKNRDWQELMYRMFGTSSAKANDMRAAKLLMALGYGNFSVVIQYDVYAMSEAFVKSGKAWDRSAFSKNTLYGLNLQGFETSSLLNSPNLSILPLLAYHKVCNDHYRNEKWQSFEPWTCNIDYLGPTDNMNATTFISTSTFTSLATSIIDLENSNLPIDYFSSVLPRAQYGDESAAAVRNDESPSVFRIFNSSDKTLGAIVNSAAPAANNNLQLPNQASVSTPDGSVSPIRSSANSNILLGFRGKLTSSSSLKISALRSATALQKYKEIQNSNDPDFANQVLAHFGIKPKVDARTSIFIGGDDKTLSINPQVNTNFQNGGAPEIKAIGIGDLSAGCKFTSSTYGMIIGIYRAVPQLDYAHVGIDRNLFKTDATDFPIPELDSLGMQTQYRCELSAPLIGLSKFISDFTVQTSPIDMAVTYGYAPRYAELKSARDYYEGGFCGLIS